MKDSNVIRQQVDVTEIFLQALDDNEGGNEIRRFFDASKLRVVRDIELQVVAGDFGYLSIIVNTEPE